MKLALVIPEWGEVAGGIATYYRHLVPAMRARGHNVQVFFGSAFVMDQPVVDHESDWVHSLTSEGFARHRSRFEHLKPLAAASSHLAAAWALFDQVNSSAGEEPFDLVECCDWGLGFVPWLNTATPLMVRLHASLGQIAQVEQLPGEAAFQSFCGLLEQLGLGWADHLVTYATANADHWARRLGRPVSMLRPPYPLEPVGAQTGNGLVSGKIQRWKGVEVLCQALQNGSDLAVDWYGRDMPTRDQGQALSMSTLMKQRYPAVWGGPLKPRGMVPPTALEKQRGKAGFVVVPSTWDVFNFTVVEAMASGIPVIASTGAGASELIDHGDNGLTFASGEPEPLAQCLRQISSMNSNERRQMGERGRQTVADLLDPEQQAERHLALYQQALAAPVRVRPEGVLDALLDQAAGGSGSLDLARNLAGRDLARALVDRGLKRLGRRS